MLLLENLPIVQRIEHTREHTLLRIREVMGSIPVEDSDFEVSDARDDYNYFLAVV